MAHSSRVTDEDSVGHDCTREGTDKHWASFPSTLGAIIVLSIS